MISVYTFTPIPTLALMALLSMMMLFVTDVYVLINYLAFAETAVVAMAVAGLLRLRWSRADMKRPIKVRALLSRSEHAATYQFQFNIAIPVTFVLMSLYILLVPFVISPVELVVAVGIISSGVPVYLLLVAYKRKPQCVQRLNCNCSQ